MTKIDLRPDHLQQVQTILRRHLPEQVSVWAFGSRANWTAKEYSDLDLALDSPQPIAETTITNLRLDFEESSLPWKVDLVNLAEVTPEFQKAIDRDKVPLPFFNKRDVAATSVTEESPPSIKPVMSLEVTIYRLSDAINIFGGGTPKRSNPNFWGGTIPWLSVTDFNSDARFVKDTLETITQDGLEKSSTRLLKNGQLIISARGTVGCLAQLTKPMAFNQSCYGLDGKEGIIENDYLYYLIKLKLAELKQKTHGAIFDTITRETFNYIDVEIPDDPKVRSEIAKVLGDLDQKIELNRQINQTLEAIAQAIFKSWFVDFDPVRAKMAVLEQGGTTEEAQKAAMAVLSSRTPEQLDQLQDTDPKAWQQLHHTAALFPAALQPSELGDIPKGWEISQLKNLSKKISKGTTPNKQDLENATDPLIVPFVKVKNILGDSEIARNSLDMIPESIHKKQLKRSVLATDDLLFSIAGTIGRVSIVDDDLDKSNTNQAVAFIRLSDKESLLELCYLTLKSERVQENVSSKVVQGVQANTSLTSIGDIQLIVPDAGLLRCWKKVSSPLIRAKRNISNKNRTLCCLRDVLLPKLLSGELNTNNLSKNKANE